MKKLILSVVLLLGALTGVKSQTSNDERTRAVMEGDNSVNIYYGTNLLGEVTKRVITAALSSSLDIIVKSSGTYGLVYEHLITDVIGLGAEFGYSKTKLDFNYGGFYNQINQFIPYYYSIDITTIRGMARANFHFVKQEKFDVYGLVSAGLRLTNIKQETSDPNVQYTLNSRSASVSVGVKPGLGFRYFFVPNFGLNLELAIGTPLACGGLSFKF
jgi:hypothetical protein